MVKNMQIEQMYGNPPKPDCHAHLSLIFGFCCHSVCLANSSEAWLHY